MDPWKMKRTNIPAPVPVPIVDSSYAYQYPYSSDILQRGRDTGTAISAIHRALLPSPFAFSMDAAKGISMSLPASASASQYGMNVELDPDCRNGVSDSARVSPSYDDHHDGVHLLKKKILRLQSDIQSRGEGEGDEETDGESQSQGATDDESDAATANDRVAHSNSSSSDS